MTTGGVSRAGIVVAVLACGPVWAGPVPGWLAAAAQMSAPGDSGAAVVLVSEQVVRIPAPGRVIATERAAVRILRGDGAEQAVARVFYDSGSDRVREFAAWLIRPGGGGDPISTSREVDFAQVGGDLYNEIRVRTVSAKDDAAPGSVFGYEWTRESRQIFLQFSFDLQGEPGCRLSRVRVELPKGWRAEGVMFHHSPVAPTIDGSRYEWELRDLPEVAAEPARPPLTSLVPRLAVTCIPPAGFHSEDVVAFSSWSDVARWLDRLTEPMHVPTPELAERARAVVRGARSLTDTLRAVGRSVQDLRYASIPLGLHRGGGYRPVPAATAFARGYGDCKDKANLMRSMLAALGIEARLAPVYAGDPDHAEESWPSPFSFNHCIVAIRSREGIGPAATVRDPLLGAFTLFDPTDPYVSFGDLPESIHGSLALVLASGTRAPVRVPRPGGRDGLERRVSLDLFDDGRIAGRLEDRAGGSAAGPLRRLARYRGERDRSATIERRISRSAGRTRIIRIEAHEDTTADRASIQVEFESAAFGRAPQRDLLAFPPFLMPSVEGPLLGLTEPRRHPIVLGAEVMRETTLVRLPEGFRVVELPAPVALEAAVGRYRAQLRLSGRTLEATRSLERPAVRLPPSEAGAAGEFMRAVRAFEQSQVVLARE